MEAAVSGRLILYADDSALLVSGRSVSVIEETLGHELTFLSEWLVDNKLSILLGKTKSILFGSKWNEMNRALGHICAHIG